MLDWSRDWTTPLFSHEFLSNFLFQFCQLLQQYVFLLKQVLSWQLKTKFKSWELVSIGLVRNTRFVF